MKYLNENLIIKYIIRYITEVINLIKVEAKNPIKTPIDDLIDFYVEYSDQIGRETEKTIIDENEDVVDGARVTLLMGDDVIFTTGLTDENGQITLSWNAVELGNMDITVIKRNHRPYEGNIEISSVGTAVSMDFDILEATSGEGENFEISLHNYGTTNANNVMAELTSPSEHVTIDSKIISYGTIMSGSSVSRSFPVNIHGTAFHMEELDFKLTITDDNDNMWINSDAAINGISISMTKFFEHAYIVKIDMYTKFNCLLNFIK